MMRRAFTAVLFTGLAFGVLAALPTNAAEPADAAKIDKLIEQLGSAKFDEREQANKDLDAIGVPALEALRKAAKGNDAEISRRSAELVKGIEKRAETQIVLKPTKIHLVFKDTPVSEAVDELKKKTGYNIVLHDPENKLKDRKVTLDTGETTFWQAFDQFCEKAGIHEAGQQELLRQIQPVPPGGLVPPGGIQPVPPIKIQPIERAPAQKIDQAENAGAGLAADEKPAVETKPVAPPAAQPAQPVAPIGRPVPPRFVQQQPGQITVVDGKPESLATDYSGAVRIRAQTKQNLFGNAQDGEILFALEITPEPKITWQRLVGVKLDKAIDDNEQKLSEVMQPNVVPGGIQFRAGGIAAPGFAPPMRGFINNLNQYSPVRLKKGDKPSKSIKELTGTVSAEVLGEPKTLITTDEILKAAGNTFKGEEGGSIKIISVDKDEKANQAKVIFEFEQPAGFTPPINVNPGGPIRGGPVPIPLPAPVLPLPPAGALQAVQIQAAPAQVVQVQVQIGGGGVAGPAILPVRPGFQAVNGSNGLKLVDDKGKAVEGQSIFMQLKAAQPGAPLTPEWVLTFPLKKDQTEAGKLTYSASKSVTVDITITLKDITLP
jgi:hypothetical protein